MSSELTTCSALPALLEHQWVSFEEQPYSGNGQVWGSDIKQLPVRRGLTEMLFCYVRRFEWPDGSVYDGEFRNNNARSFAPVFAPIMDQRSLRS